MPSQNLARKYSAGTRVDVSHLNRAKVVEDLSAIYGLLRQPTKMQQGVLDILADGQLHLFSEIFNSLYDEQDSVKNLYTLILRIRKELLNPIGHDITCESRYHRTYYRHVVTLGKAGLVPATRETPASHIRIENCL